MRLVEAVKLEAAYKEQARELHNTLYLLKTKALRNARKMEVQGKHADEKTRTRTRAHEHTSTRAHEHASTEHTSTRTRRRPGGRICTQNKNAHVQVGYIVCVCVCVCGIGCVNERNLSLRYRTICDNASLQKPGWKVLEELARDEDFSEEEQQALQDEIKQHVLDTKKFHHQHSEYQRKLANGLKSGKLGNEE